jgi:hypothetical protein
MIATATHRMGRLADHLAGTCTHTAEGSSLACGNPAPYRVERINADGKRQRGMRCTNHAAKLAHDEGMAFPPGFWTE